MEKLIRNLFDFQKFEPEESLAQQIRDTAARYRMISHGRALCDDELEHLFAAGNSAANIAGEKRHDVSP